MLYGIRLRLSRYERDIGIRNAVFGKSAKVRWRIKDPQPTDEKTKRTAQPNNENRLTPMV